jgi:hypothetical protein
MWCQSLAAHITLRHDILNGILRRVVHRAGIASTQEPALRRLPELSGGAGTSSLGENLHSFRTQHAYAGISHLSLWLCGDMRHWAQDAEQSHF